MKWLKQLFARPEPEKPVEKRPTRCELVYRWNCIYSENSNLLARMLFADYHDHAALNALYWSNRSQLLELEQQMRDSR